MKKLLSKVILLTIFTLSFLGATPQNQLDKYTQSVLNKMVTFYNNGIDEKLYLQLDKPYYSSGDKIWFKGYLRNAITHAPLELSNFIYVELVDKDDKLVNRVKVKRDNTGFNGYLTLDPEMTPNDYTIRGYTRWMTNKSDDYFFSQAIKIISPIPPKSEDNETQKESAKERRKREQKAELSREKSLNYDLQFFPEGGALLAGGSQTIAFKAIAEDGLSVEVSGEIYNNSGEEVCSFSSTHKGMGQATIYVADNTEYYAVARSAKGIERRFDLPKVETVGAVLNTKMSNDKLIFQTRTSKNLALKDAHIIINARGRIVSANSIKGATTNIISTDQLFDGINTISLIDASGKILSERLVFKRPEYTPTLTFSANKDNYGRRERAQVKINVLDSYGKAAQGEFGVSITDDSSVQFDSEADNILSNLLLTSDLQGHIEDPGYYFTADTSQADAALDLLMLTQGWRRFDIGKVLNGELNKPTTTYEEMVEISGEVKGFFGNAARKPIIHVLCPKIGFFNAFKLDKSSKFNLQGLDIPDSTTYVIQARGRRGGNSLTLKIKPEHFPTPHSTLFPRDDQEEEIPLAFVNQSQEKFFNEGGMELINMDAVYVTATKEESSSTLTPSSRSSNREELDKMFGLSLPLIIQRFPSMTITVEGVTYRNNTTMARFILDGMYVEYDEVSHLTANQLERIDFFDAVDAIVYNDASGGVFVLESRTGSDIGGGTKPLSIVDINHLGYQRPSQLYQPRYNVASLKQNLPPDHRTTIFWDGTLTPDSNGDIEFSFYTADKATTYTVTVEGVTTEGEICLLKETINRSASR